MAIVKEHIFDTKEEMAQQLGQLLESKLLDAVKLDGSATLMVSGGSSPAPAYKYLSTLDLGWDNIAVAMVDERWVNSDHEKSNEAFIRSTLLQNKAERTQFITMKNAHPTADLGQPSCEQAYSELKSPDLVILGMGPDGHTASLFPNADGLKNAFETTDRVCAINAIQSDVTGSITERMSLSLSCIAEAKDAVLLISGDEKRSVYEQAKLSGSHFDIPLRAVIEHPDVNLTVFWCP